MDPEKGDAHGIEVERSAGGIGDNVDGTARSEPPTNSDENGASNGSSSSNNAGDNEDDSESKGMSLQELIYGASSYHAVVKPVAVTMILASLATIYINTDESRATGEQGLQIYQAFTISEDQNAATSLGLSLVNGLIMVCGIGAMTFFIVLLYKYRCMKCLIGYMVLASTMMLGILGGNMFMIAINKYSLTIDQISFYVTMYNFAIVGVVAVFYQKGIPTYINQAYLVATSVIVAWQLSYFNAWMAWALLIMLALYDLCAVLTPCGPLKLLVNLLSKDDAPSMPGLLYEAQLPENATRPGRQKKRRINESTPNNSTPNESSNNAEQNTESGNDGNIDNTPQEDGPREDTTEANDIANINVPETTQQTPSARTETSLTSRKRRSRRHNDVPEEATSSHSSRNVQAESSASVAVTVQESASPTTTLPLASSRNAQSESSRSVAVQESASPTTTLPLAIAKVYKLPILADSSGPNRSFQRAYLQQELTVEELRANVEAKLPRGGGTIETTRNKKAELRYVVKNKDGEVKRTLCVGENGKVMEITYSEGMLQKEDNTIKLGLGDFIFYSVLVSKAAENGFAAFVACFLSILAGLGGTLVLLAVYHHALPALPISIFLAVIMFVLTIYCMEPWIQDMWRAGPYYV